MSSTDLPARLEVDLLSQEMYRLIAELYPICRSITGNGFRDTLRTIQRFLPLDVHEVPTGTPVFDWTVPKEWNIRDAYVKNMRGERIIDFKQSNLHVVSYSIPVQATVSLAELKEHLFTLPEQPAVIPYRTSYYTENWGFCLSHNQFMTLQEAEYEVYIDASLAPGHLTYGEAYLAGQQAEEILISCHACHPSLCNDNLSGIALATFLARTLRTYSHRFSYRFLFIPGTIGSITWLCRNEANLAKIKHGLVLTCVGDAGKTTYKRSRQGNTEIDRTFTHVLQHSGTEYDLIDFFPYGYDERQYCSPAFNLPVGCFMRTPHGRFAEYHTSADNLAFVQPPSLADSFAKCLAGFYVLENNRCYLNQNPKCEPQLGKRGLYRAIGGHSDTKLHELAMLWVLNFSDGQHTLLDIAERAGMDFRAIKTAADALVAHDLLAEVPAVRCSTSSKETVQGDSFHGTGRRSYGGE